MSKTETEMPDHFEPQAVEAGWYARWEQEGLFVADAKSKKPKYTICLPPPNITGELHMGHALNHTLQDICARYRRMAGYCSCQGPTMRPSPRRTSSRSSSRPKA